MAVTILPLRNSAITSCLFNSGFTQLISIFPILAMGFVNPLGSRINMTWCFFLHQSIYSIFIKINRKF